MSDISKITLPNNEEYNLKDNEVRQKIKFQSNKNLIVNGYFIGGGSQKGDGVFPINQRGQTSYLGAVTGIDRWSVTSGASSSVTIDTVDNDGIIFKNTVASNRFSQELPKSLAGKTVTLTALCTSIDNARYRVCVNDGTTNYSDLVSDGIASVTCQIADNATTIYAQVLVEGAGSSVKIHAIKLELGSYQTLAHEENGDWVLNEIPNYGEELAKCQRYFLKIATRGATALGCGYSNGTENIRISIPLPVTMAASVSSTPTVTVSDLSSLKLIGGGTIKTPTAIDGVYFADNCVTISFTVSDAAENVAYTLKPTGTTFYISV